MYESDWSATFNELKAFSGKVHLGEPEVGTPVSQSDLIVLEKWDSHLLLRLARKYSAQVSIISSVPLVDELQAFVDWVFPDMPALTLLQDFQALSTLSNNKINIPATNGNPSAALLLDRDGVVNVDHGYVGKVDMVALIDGASALIRAANAKGRKVVIATNQSGVARGYYSVTDFDKVMAKIIELLDQDLAKFDHIERALFHPESKMEAFRWNRQLRKPRPGMIHRAAKKLNLDLPNSILVGDKASDLKSAVLAGVGRVFLFDSKSSAAEWQNFESWRDRLMNDFALTDLMKGTEVKQISQLGEIKDL